jgi:hypothetical protein
MHWFPGIGKEAGHIDFVWRPGNGLATTHQFNSISLKLVIRRELEKPQGWVLGIIGWFN